jgi:eukaryotic-like serine/threonine-protein kinase
MAFSAGERLGAYHIVAALGAGGMGEVYRARDTKLGRDVALKTLPAAFIGDPDRVARFRREAQVLATLNHPHIAAIHGLEEDAGCQFLVLELAEGETLERRLAQSGPMPIDDAIAVARQVADALEAAHEKGIVHRDLKPANIAVASDGRVKVLDFGLAKALDPAGTPDVSMSPTLTFAATQAGVILGTAAYMSPEQAKGRPTDKRTDVWAFGCVLFEMLTARRAFEGEDVTDTIAAVVRGEPDWTRLPADTPPHIRLLLRRCLDKDRRTRVPDIGVARFLMTEAIASVPTSTRTQPRWTRRAAAGGAAIVAASAIAAAGALVGARWNRPPVRPTARFVIVPPAAQPLFLQGTDRDVAVSPDGTNLVYRSGLGASSQFAVRQIGDVNARLLNLSGREPFISADGRWLGFWAAAELRKVSLAGGAAIKICDVATTLRGAHWTADDHILFGTIDPRRGVQRVPASGGEPEILTKPDTAHGEVGHYYPFMLPDGRSVLFTVAAPGPIENARIALLDVPTKQYRTLIRGGSAAVYVDPGYIVYAAGGGLRAVRFDSRRLEVQGDPVQVVDQVMVSSLGDANFSVSRAGTLVYVPGSAVQSPNLAPRSMVWVARNGKESALKADARPYGTLRLSPDATRVAMDVRTGTFDIWVWDLARETLMPIDRDPAVDMAPIWSADGRRIIWASTRAGGNPNLYWQAADGSGTPERLTTSVTAQFPTSTTPDGSHVLLYSPNGVTGGIGTFAALDIFRLALTPPGRQPEVLLQSAAQKFGGEVSPDGRWLAYESNEAGQPQVFVRPYPNVDAGRWQMSTAGGTRPLWARNGRELFFLDGSDLLTSVAIHATASSFDAGKPVRLLSTKYVGGSTTRGYNLRAYDVSPDGQQFLMLKEPTAPSTPAPSPTLTVVMNWLDELNARVPAR